MAAAAVAISLCALFFGLRAMGLVTHDDWLFIDIGLAQGDGFARVHRHGDGVRADSGSFVGDRNLVGILWLQTLHEVLDQLFCLAPLVLGQ